MIGSPSLRQAVCGAVFLLCGLGTATGQAGPAAVVELFTSQGCGASPAADGFAAELAHRPDLLVLTLPVDYWDYLGWKDTLGSPTHSSRQRAYALVRGDRKVFTPQMVVNGRMTTVGGDRGAVNAALDQALRPGLDALPVTLRDEQQQIAIEMGAGHGDGELWLVAVASARTVQIARGENAAHAVTYTNVVRRMTRLGAWNGKPAHFLVPRAEVIPEDADRYLVLLQKGSGSMPGPILGIYAP